MAYAERHEVTVTTATGGGATAFTPVVTGRVANIIYTVAATGVSFASTADFAITAERTGLGLWTEDNVTTAKTVSPTQPANTQVGGGLATAGDVQRAPIYVANERIQITIAQGGNTKQGIFTVVVA